MQVVEPHKERLFRIGASPFAKLQAEYPNLAIHSDRTCANIMYDLMVDYARIEFRGVRDTRIVDLPYGVTLLEIDDQILIRFKKLDEESLPRNYPTERNRDYYLGEDLPGIPSSPQRLTLGYRLNRFRTQVQDVLISNVLAGRLLYDIILDEPDDGIIVMPDSNPNAPDLPKPQRRVRIRGSAEQAEI